MKSFYQHLKTYINEETSDQSSDQQSELLHEASCEGDEGPCIVQDDNAESVNAALFLRHLALFYLKLQSKCLLPSSVIQTIASEFQEIHDMSKKHLLVKLRDKLAGKGCMCHC